jgi:hypothetical protein
VTEQGWFLTDAERGNDATGLDRRRGDGSAWSEGNEVRPLVHGATYFARLLEVLSATGAATPTSYWTGPAPRSHECSARRSTAV